MGSLYGRLLSEDDGSTTKVTYNGRDKIVMAGTVDGKASTITLTRASDGTIGWAVSDNLDEDLSEELEYDAEAEKAKYNEGRVDGFLEWNDGLDELTVSMAADKREIRATEDSNELNLDNLKGESRTWNCSPPRKQKTLTLHNSSPFPDIKRSITVRRSQSIIINNYAIHNFSDGSDWYIVRFGGTLNPSGQYKREDNDGRPDYVWGHTGYYTLAAVLDPSASGITLIDTAPKNANKTQIRRAEGDPHPHGGAGSHEQDHQLTGTKRLFLFPRGREAAGVIV